MGWGYYMQLVNNKRYFTLQRLVIAIYCYAVSHNYPLASNEAKLDYITTFYLSRVINSITVYV